MNHEQSIAVFRIFQEALTNILRHANATRVDIAADEQAGEFILTIRDNGKGITDEAKSRPLSLGLLGMQERAHLVGGTIDITGMLMEKVRPLPFAFLYPARRRQCELRTPSQAMKNVLIVDDHEVVRDGVKNIS